MQEALLFQVANTLAFMTWLFLIIFPRTRYAQILTFTVTITLFSLAYSALLFYGLGNFDPQSFSTLEGIKVLFQSDMAVLTGWLHYLAFDLMVGLYIVTDAQKRRIPHAWIVLPLFFTFMFGPLGLLIYCLIRKVKKGTWSYI